MLRYIMTQGCRKWGGLCDVKDMLPPGQLIIASRGGKAPPLENPCCASGMANLAMVFL